jgi:hypothetical protein
VQQSAASRVSRQKSVTARYRNPSLLQYGRQLKWRKRADALYVNVTSATDHSLRASAMFQKLFLWGGGVIRCKGERDSTQWNRKGSGENGRMYGLMDNSMDILAGGSIGRWTDRWTHERVNGWTDERMDGQVNGWTVGWTDGQMDGWMDMCTGEWMKR